MPGYIQIYTGNGKGKTTAALGLALRAAGAGLRVFIGQFLKTKTCSEHKALERFRDLITVSTFGRPGFVTVPTQEDRYLASQGWETCVQAMRGGQYKLVVMDEINVALHLGLLDLQEVLKVIKARPEDLEVVLTGRYASSELIAVADLVTEMKEIKHYYTQKVRARKGFEY